MSKCFTSILLLALSISSHAQNAHAEKATEQKTQHAIPTQVPQPSERGTQQHPLIVEKSATEQTQDALQQDADNKRDEGVRKRDFWVTVAIAITGFLQFIVLGGQLLLFFRQTTLMENSLGEARRAADAAQDSADEARDTARLTQCADVLIELIEMENAQPSFSPSTRFILQFKNFGPTRANNVRFDFTLSIGTLGDLQVPVSPVVLGANGTAPLVFKTFKELMIVPNIPDIEAGKIPMHFRGTISYEDVFGKNHAVDCTGEYNRFTRNFNAKQTPKQAEGEVRA